MPDLNLISPALSSINGTNPIVLGLLSLDRALDKAEDKAQLVGVLYSLSEAHATTTEQCQRMRELHTKLDLRAVMECRAPAYWE